MRRVRGIAPAGIGGDGSLQTPLAMALPLRRWFYPYLGMIPAAVYTDPGPSPYHNALIDFLAEIGCSEALNPEEIQQMPHVVLANGAVLARIEAMRISVAGVELALSGKGRIEVMPKAVMDARGTLYFNRGDIERIDIKYE